MYRKCNKCNQNNILQTNMEDYYENSSCLDIQNDMNMYDDCDCGFDDDFSYFPENPMLAESYVPKQIMDKTFVPSVGLKMGTIYPELVGPYEPGQSMEVDRYLKATNEIGKGCNGC